MFSTVTSAFLSSSRTISSPRGDFRFKVTDFLLALNWWKYHGSSGWPGCSRRPGSPVRGFSTFTTSAPSHARASVHEGPASNWVKSTTRMPSRQLSSTLMPIAHLSRCDHMPIIVLIIPAEATHRPYRGGEESRHPWVSQLPNSPLTVCLHRVRFTSVTRHWWLVCALRVRANKRHRPEYSSARLRPAISPNGLNGTSTADRPHSALILDALITLAHFMNSTLTC